MQTILFFFGVLSISIVNGDFVNTTGQCISNLKVDPKATIDQLVGIFDSALTSNRGPLQRNSLMYKLKRFNESLTIATEFYKEDGSHKQQHLEIFIYPKDEPGRYSFVRQNTADSPIYTTYDAGVLYLSKLPPLIVAYLCRNATDTIKEDEILVASLTHRISNSELQKSLQVLTDAGIDYSYLQYVQFPSCAIDIVQCAQLAADKFKVLLTKSEP